jgi:hypothetical protein
MRYSRFRASMLGIEPQKRNRTATSKNRVTKSKKDGKAKKTKDSDSVKEDPDSQESGIQDTDQMESPRVKREMSQLPPDGTMMSSMFSRTSAPMSAVDMQSQLQARLLTPCSDSDALAASSSYGASPGSDMLHVDASYDFTGSSPCAHAHEQMTWTHGHPYQAFGVNFELDGYSTESCNHENSHIGGDQLSLHQHNHHRPLAGQDYGVHHHSQLGSQELRVTNDVMEGNDRNVMVKHEDWDQTAF